MKLRELGVDLVESLEQVKELVEDRQGEIDAVRLRESLLSLQR